MKILWLNQSLVLRAETKSECEALAVVFHGIKKDEPDEPEGDGEIEGIKDPVFFSSN